MNPEMNTILVSQRACILRKSRKREIKPRGEISEGNRELRDEADMLRREEEEYNTEQLWHEESEPVCKPSERLHNLMTQRLECGNSGSLPQEELKIRDLDMMPL